MESQSVGEPLFNVSKELVLRDCNEGLLVFDAMNGKTTLLNERAGQVLRALISVRNVPESVLRRVSGMEGDDYAPEFGALVSALQDSELVDP